MSLEAEERLLRRGSFDAIADIYDAGRPSYPDELYDDLLNSVHSQAGVAPEVLEVGPGTGKATQSLLERGCRVTAVELGPRLAAMTREKLAGFGRQLEIIVGEFEQVELPADAFDLVASASAFHWIDPAVGVPKVVRMLRSGGLFALWGMGNAESDADHPFREEVRAIYEELGVPQHSMGAGRWREADGRPRAAAVIEDSGLFGPVEIRGYRRDITYTRDQYLQLVASYSMFQTLSSEQQSALRGRIGTLIDERYGGTIVRAAAATLCMATPL